MDESDNVVPLPSAPDAIELRHLRAFVAVAEELNFSRAAARLYLSAPALSRQIQALERLVGCDLLRRNTHRAELTIAGEALLDCARNLLRDLDRGVSATRSVGGEMHQRIARFWAPVLDLARPDIDLQALRDASESLQAQFTPPPDAAVRSVNAGGVPSLQLTTRPGEPPTLLHLHGGAFVMGSAFGFRPLAGTLAVAAQTNLLLPEYRLAPEHPYPAALEDALRAYLWLLDSGVPPGRVTISGDSSGGHLAMTLLLSLKEQDMPLPGGALLMCPIADITCASMTPPPPETPPVMTAEMARALIDLYLGGHPIDDPLLNPLTADLSGLPPLLIQVATGDFVTAEAQALADHARAQGVDVRLELYPADTHVFHIFWSFLPEAADALAQAGRFAHDVAAGHTLETGTGC